ncbi:hypothetical protein MNBD_DELTA02-542 [hydrothermal vent metagenome]|uniref:malonyl-[acyl-carrier protein] O-methyltransferase n=1 Tax=hydrothermal vent metagenome TaxID=652676 RepID=A0A3B0UTT4_9ZZZZ
MRPYERKTVIKQAFEKAARSYANSSGLQLQVAKELAAMIKDAPGRTLDIGTGTGYLAEAIKERFQEAELLACDVSHEMLKIASANAAPLRAFAADCEELPVKDSSFDCVVSSLTYQWSSDLTTSMLEAERVLRPGGSFVFSTLGKGTMAELKKAARAAYRIKGIDTPPHFMDFPSAEEVGEALVAVGFEDIKIEKDIKEVVYKDLWELLKTLKDIGATNPEPPVRNDLSGGSLLRAVAKTYARLAPGPDNNGITATYEILKISARCA